MTRSTVLYTCETWTLAKEWEQILEILERKILRKIYEGIKAQEQWRRRTNKEVEVVY